MLTIKSKEQIELFFKDNSKCLNLPGIKILILKDPSIKGNFCYIAGKKNGNAVWRNKSKRRLREISKFIYLKNDYKLAFIAKKNINSLNFENLKNNCLQELKKIGILINDK